MQQPPPPVVAANQVQAGGVAVVHQQPRSRLNVKVIRGLGITQIIIGALSIILGIVIITTTESFWARNIGAAIWAGVWIGVTGILGASSASNPNNGCLNGTHLAFCIVSCIIAFIDGIFFAIALGYYNNCYIYNNYNSYSYYGGVHYKYTYSYNYYYKSYTSKMVSYYSYNYNPYNYWVNPCYADRDVGKGVYGVMLLLMIVEFFIAIVAAAFCCAGSSCCDRQTSGVIIQQQSQPQTHVFTTQYGQPGVQYGQPGVVAGQQVSYVHTQPGQPMVSYGYPMQTMTQAPSQPYPGTTVAYPQPQQAATNMTYSSASPGYPNQAVAAPPGTSMPPGNAPYMSPNAPMQQKDNSMPPPYTS